MGKVTAEPKVLHYKRSLSLLDSSTFLIDQVQQYRAADISCCSSERFVPVSYLSLPRPEE
jgi:hypothetical protein